MVEFNEWFVILFALYKQIKLRCFVTVEKYENSVEWSDWRINELVGEKLNIRRLKVWSGIEVVTSWVLVLLTLL
jgi:hypothetical protein